MSHTTLDEVSFTSTSAAQPMEPVANTSTSLTHIELRDRWRVHADEYRYAAEEARRDALVATTAELARQEPRDLLATLSDKWGMSWSDIARLVGVSVPALRKWRMGEPPSGMNRSKIARLVAFLELLSRAPVHDPVGWLEVPIVPGYSVRGIDLYAADKIDLLLDYAYMGLQPQSVLEQFDSDWHVKYREAFEIVDDAVSGERFIRRRGG
jgi:hypothetical protein